MTKNRKDNKPKNIITIAKELGLAPSTVSKALNDKGYVKKETKERILSYIKEVGYIRDSSARILKSGKSFNLGVLFSDISLVGLSHPFYSTILQSFKNYVETKSYEISFVVSQVGDKKMSYYEWCRHKRVDGVLLVSGNLNNEYIVELVESEIPCVSTDFIRPNLVSVISDSQMGIEKSLSHAKELNKERVALISGPISSYAFEQRYLAFDKLTQKNTYQNKIIAKGFDYEAGFNAALEMLDNNITSPDFVVVGSDNIAFGVIRGIESKGFRVPEDIMVIGFDNIRFSELYTPSLSTIKQNYNLIGQLAAEKLISMINNEETKRFEVIKVPVEIVKRNSTSN